MNITSKGQVTIPKEIRDAYRLNPYTEVQFVEEAGRVYIQAVEGKAPKNRFSRFRGSADVKLSTDEILALTRGE